MLTQIIINFSKIQAFHCIFFYLSLFTFSLPLHKGCNFSDDIKPLESSEFPIVVDPCRQVHQNNITIGDLLETDMPDRRPTCLIGNQNAWTDTEKSDQRPNEDQPCLIKQVGRSPMRHVGLQWDMSVFNKTCWSPTMLIFLWFPCRRI